MVTNKYMDVLKDIRNKVYYPIYYLMGEEAFYIDVISDYLEEQVLTETEKEFNLSIVYGKDTDIPQIVSMAKRYPMMSSHNLVIVKEAQHIKDMEELLPYAENPLNSTILVICHKYGKLDGRTQLSKTLKKTGVVFEGKKLFDNQIPQWIADYIKRKGFRIGPKAVQLLADHLGSDLGKIVGELRKLFINLKKGEEISEEIIERNVGISKEFNIFEYQDALGVKDHLKAHQIARYFADNPKSNPVFMVTASLSGYFSKILLYHVQPDKSQANVASALGISPFFVKGYAVAARNYPKQKILKIFSWLREYDIKSKGVDNETTPPGDLIREMTHKILN